MTEDFYEILGVSRDASEEEIEDAYREAVREYHPDVSDAPDAEEKFKKAKTAKEVLTDEEQRQMYDQMGHERFIEAQKRGATDEGGAGRGGGRGDPFGGGGGFGNMQDIFDQFFGNNRSNSRPSRGRDLKTELEIDLEEAYHGTEKQLSVTRPDVCGECDGRGHPPGTDARTCPQCDGRGQTTQVRQTAFGRMQQRTTCRRCEGEGTIYEERCSTCGGDGVVRDDATLTVEIPAGIRDGQTLRMDGEGAPGERGARKGDMHVEISIRDHPEFDREDDDLKKREAISFPQAVFGDTIEVETFDGPVEFDVPAGTQSGETFRLGGKGMPKLRSRRRQGDLYIQVRVVTPESLNAEQREALEQFAEAGGEDIEVEQGFFDRLRNSF